MGMFDDLMEPGAAPAAATERARWKTINRAMRAQARLDPKRRR